MLKFQIASTVLVGFLLTSLSIANAQTLTVTVVDQQGQPLADAVVSIDNGQSQQPLASGAIMDQV
ncbi:hypothetical protein C9940_06540, partial [Pseudidiomarina aestuarii]